MTPYRYPSALVSLSSALLLLLFAAFSMNAEEEKKNEQPKGNAPHSGSAKPAANRPQQREAQPSRTAQPQERQQSQRQQSSPGSAQQQQAKPNAGQQPQQGGAAGRQFGQNQQQQSTPATGQQPQRGSFGGNRQSGQTGQQQATPATGQQPQQGGAAGGRQFGQNQQQQSSPAAGQQTQRGGFGSNRQSGQTGQQPMYQPGQQQQGAGRQQPRAAQDGRQTTGGQPPQPGGFAGSRQSGQPAMRNAGGPQREMHTANGGMVRRSEAGRVTEVHTRGGAVIMHAPSGVRRVEMVRPGGRMVVASAPGRGYMQRQIVFQNRTIIKRTYIVGGVPYARVYRPVHYGGVVLNVYTPVRYYRPTFYAYAYNPWYRPVSYWWGWAGSPWYGYYGGYFTPYPVYSSPALWLTDYMIAATLQAAYEERIAAAAQQSNYYPPAGQVTMTPEVKQAIADEVRRQVDQERAEGQRMNANAAGGGDAPPMFADNAAHVFVAFTSLAVNSNAGECVISEGDVLQMNGPPPPNASAADVVVLASRGGQDCRKGSIALVQLQDLQEMQNRMRETIDRGLGDLQSRQGQGGLPALPSGAAGTIDTPLAAEAAPDPNVTSEISQVTQDASRAEQEVLSQSPDSGTSGTGTSTLALGQTLDEVLASQGQPQKIVDLGSKKILVYKDLKITLIDGKVADVQ
jgi:hypothetical protein